MAGKSRRVFWTLKLKIAKLSFRFYNVKCQVQTCHMLVLNLTRGRFKPDTVNFETLSFSFLFFSPFGKKILLQSKPEVYHYSYLSSCFFAPSSILSLNLFSPTCYRVWNQLKDIFHATNSNFELLFKFPSLEIWFVSLQIWDVGCFISLYLHYFFLFLSFRHIAYLSAPDFLSFFLFPPPYIDRRKMNETVGGTNAVFFFREHFFFLFRHESQTGRKEKKISTFSKEINIF